MVIFKNRNNFKVFILASLFGILAAGCRQPSIASLIKDLGSKQPTVRQAASKMLIEKGNQASVPLLRAIRANNNYVTKTNAIKTLGEMGETRAIKALISSLNDSDYRIVEQAEIALAKIGKSATPRLIETLQKDQRFFVRFEAAKVLGQGGDERAIKPLIAALRDNDSLVREGACAALIDLGGEKPALFLIGALSGRREGFRDEKTAAWTTNKRMIKLLNKLLAKDMNGWVKYKTVKSLGDMHSSGVILLTQTLLLDADLEDLEENWGNKEGFRQIGKLSVAPLLEILKSKAAPPTKASIPYLLGSIGDKRAVQPLIGLLRNRDSDLSRAAARALGELKAKSAGAPLLSALSQAEEDDRYTVYTRAFYIMDIVEALGKIGTKRAAKPLIKLLKHPNGWIRFDAVTALGEIGDARAVEPLISVFKHDDFSRRRTYTQEIKTEAAIAIAKIGSNQAIDFLVSTANRPATATAKDSGKLVQVNSSPFSLRYHALSGLSWLGQSGSKRTIDTLIKLEKSKDRDIRQAAVAALGGIKIGPTMRVMASETDNPDPQMRMIAVNALVPHSQATLKALKLALNDKSGRVRMAAVINIRRKAGDQAVIPLITMLRDENETVKEAAVLELGYSRDKRAFSQLIKVAKQKRNTIVKRAAIFSLGQLDDRRAVLTLSQIAHSTRHNLQYQAQVALIRLGVIYGRPVDWTLRN